MKNNRIRFLILIFIIIFLGNINFMIITSNNSNSKKVEKDNNDKYVDVKELLLPSWPNGESTPKMCAQAAIDIGQDPVDYYRLFYENSYSQFYCIHDFIAEFATDYLKESGKSNCNWLTDKNRRFFYIYLLATEFPDYKSAPDMTLDCGKSTIYSNFYSGSIHSGITACTLAATRASSARKALLNKDTEGNPDPLCETAAFYLGAMTHYIADLANPYHSTPYISDNSTGIRDKGFHDWHENNIAKFTLLLNHNDMWALEWPMEIDLLKYIGYTPDNLDIENGAPIDVKNAAERMMFTTYYNLEVDFMEPYPNVGVGSYDAAYFHTFYLNHTDFQLTAENRDFGEQKIFYDRQEILLNWAIYYCSVSIKQVLEGFDGNCPECHPDDDDGNSAQPPDNGGRDGGSGDRIRQTSLYEFMGRSAAAVGAGTVATIIAKRRNWFKMKK